MATQLKSVDVAVIGLGAAGRVAVLPLAHAGRNVDSLFGAEPAPEALGLRDTFVDASVMGTSGARNPTLTAQALAWRTADHLVKNWKSFQ